MTTTHPHFFITRCAFCQSEKSREEKPELEKDIVSHGICTPICEPARKLGWARFMKKEDGGEM